MEEIFSSNVQLFKFCLFIASGGFWNYVFPIYTGWETAPLTRETTGDLYTVDLTPLVLLIYFLFPRYPHLSIHTARQLQWLCNWEDYQKCLCKKENGIKILFVILGCLAGFALSQHYQQWVPSTQVPTMQLQHCWVQGANVWLLCDTRIEPV